MSNKKFSEKKILKMKIPKKKFPPPLKKKVKLDRNLIKRNNFLIN